MLCLGMHSNVMLRFMVQAFQDPPLCSRTLKVPKRENFSLAFFALSEPIWVCNLGTGPKNPFFYHLTPDSERFWFFVAY